MNKITFIIYGASSDVVSPIFDEFKDSEFICLVNKSKPDYLLGEILDTNQKSFLNNLENSLNRVDERSLIVYLNAAVFQKDELFISHKKDDLEKMLEVGINKNLSITEVVLKEMIKRKEGRLINLSSFRSKAPSKGTAIYSAVKSFNETFFNALGIEYGRFNITCNSIALGFADSKLLYNLNEEKISSFKKSISKRFFLPSDEFMLSIKFLIDSKYTNSAVLDLNGGLNYLD